MQLTELQTYSLSHKANMPFSSASSEDDAFACITEKGVDILAGVSKAGRLRWLACLLLLLTLVVAGSAEDITSQMFGDRTDGFPGAFGDFNSDELTDLFVIRNNGKTLEILLANEDKEPKIQSHGLMCNFSNAEITSIVPGDFNGDALMDVMVTLMSNSAKEREEHINHVVLIWGNKTKINCSETTLFTTKGQPLAIDYDKNMIIDLFGIDANGTRTFWVFNENKTAPEVIHMPKEDHFHNTTRIPHSHAFVDLNNDYLPDLYVTTHDNFEIWTGEESGGFRPWKIIDFPPNYGKNYGPASKRIGQTIFLDIELKGKLDHIVPICLDPECIQSKIFVYSNWTWHDLHVDFKEQGTADMWGFALVSGKPYLDTITLRAGDFNMDGYPDIMATLISKNSKVVKSFFLENVPCDVSCDFSRTFKVQWNSLSSYNNNTLVGVFFDFLQDGVLDVIFVHYKGTSFTMSAYKNKDSYDANFLKVMVVTGLTNKDYPLTFGRLRKSTKVYGTNLPGPKISYVTTTQEGDPRKAVAAQIPQSAHYSLNLPYTIFGLGRTANFIDTVTIGVYGKHHKWTQLIPNSQIIAVPSPINEPSLWRVQLFVTPSQLIVNSVLALLATCIVIAVIIAGLYWKERKEDHRERLQEAHRFHFDAM